MLKGKRIFDRYGEWSVIMFKGLQMSEIISQAGIASARVAKTQRRTTQELLQLSLSQSEPQAAPISGDGIGGAESAEAQLCKVSVAMPELIPALFR
ncbi:MAG: hypothetical protein ACP5VQ_00570 [Phycisphaerae bacterium]